MLRAGRAMVALLCVTLLTAVQSGYSQSTAQSSATSSTALRTQVAKSSAIDIDLRVSAGTSPNGYVLTWASASPLDIYVADTPEAPLNEARRIATSVEAPQYAWQAEDQRRRYFFLATEATVVAKAAVRLLPLEGGRNFRDLGGYETVGGQRVRWGRVFRSGTMHELTDADHRYLASLGITTICDYRSKAERNRQPTRWLAGDADYLTFEDPEDAAGGSMMAMFRDPAITPEQVSDGMAAGYAEIAKQHAEAYAAMFDRLAAGEIPLAFNCSAGKDRAGMSAALLLTALGVPRSTVVADYALSEQYVDYAAAFLEEEPSSSGTEDPYAFLRELPRPVVAPLLRSDPKYVERALADLAAEFGSVEAFIRTELKVTEAELASIKAALLES